MHLPVLCTACSSSSSIRKISFLKSTFSLLNNFVKSSTRGCIPTQLHSLVIYWAWQICQKLWNIQCTTATQASWHNVWNIISKTTFLCFLLLILDSKNCREGGTAVCNQVYFVKCSPYCGTVFIPLWPLLSNLSAFCQV